MDELVKKQLNQCRVASIPQFDDSTTQIFIPKYDDAKVQTQKLVINKCFLCKVDKDVMEQFKDALLQMNDKPFHSSYLKIVPTSFLSSFVKVDAIECDILTQEDTSVVYLAYWLPVSAITILNEID